MNRSFWTCALLGLWCSTARAAPDVFGAGDGHEGDVDITDVDTVVNHYSALSEDVAAGATSIQVSTVSGSAGSFAAGDLILLWQFGGLTTPGTPGSAAPIDLSGEQTGRWELARIASVSGNSLALDAPVSASFAIDDSQVVRVPEYATLSIAAGASVVPRAFDGLTGGIVVLFAADTLTVEGEIDAKGAGFRGGPGSPSLSCEEAAAGARGEPLSLEGLTVHSADNLAHAGGGGSCLAAGGGGGALSGVGGHGGTGLESVTGGLGGAALTAELPSRLLMGGAGGAGHGDALSSGGSGGGVVLVRAKDLFGAGSVGADGAQGADSDGSAGGGGGGGGSIVLASETSLCLDGHAHGARGGASGPGAGPGGGGGGGRILLYADFVDPDCQADEPALAGAAGTSASNATAEAGSAGSLLSNDQALVVDADGDTLPDVFEGLLDSDNDSTPDYLDPDDDGDGVYTYFEAPGLPGKLLARDTDSDGTPDYLDTDDDGDNIPTAVEHLLGSSDDDVPAHIDADDDNDGIPTKDEDPNGDGDPTNDNTDGKGNVDYLDTDDDDDGLPTALERDDVGHARDWDHDGTYDHLDADDDNDTIPTSFERYAPIESLLDQDTDGDIAPDYLDADDDGDTVPTKNELGSGGHLAARNTDNTAPPDYRDDDDDGDGIPTADERPIGADNDSNYDGKADHLQAAVDGTVLTDSDGDQLPDVLDDDDDDDGILDTKDASPRDDDEDNDGLLTRYERVVAGDIDTDGDRIPDYLDPDDDDDEIPTRDEHPDANGDGNPNDALNTSGRANYLSEDDDGDGLLTLDERRRNPDADFDEDGLLDYLDADDDNDTLQTRQELTTLAGGFDARLDTDHDGSPNSRDADDDGDGIPTQQELQDATAALAIDVDRDGIPCHLDIDSDGDGLPDAQETRDQDSNGVPDYLEPETAPADNDADGVPNNVECPAAAAECPDSDGDGKPDLKDTDDDDDGLLTMYELGSGSLRNTDGDSKPDYLDRDDDNDTLPTSKELNDDRTQRDSDGDDVSDHRDDDDDDDGVPTAEEVDDGTVLDLDEDGVPDYLDPDYPGEEADGGVQKGDGGTTEVTPEDVDDDGGGGGGSCATLASARTGRGELWVLLGLGWFAHRRHKRKQLARG